MQRMEPGFGLLRAEAQGIAAKGVTPFLLDRIFELTEGRSLDANIALVLANARLAARIAAAADALAAAHFISHAVWPE